MTEDLTDTGIPAILYTLIINQNAVSSEQLELSQKMCLKFMPGKAMMF